MTNHYVYKVVDPTTGGFYIGKRTCHCEPSADIYFGSGTWPKAVQKIGRPLQKSILAVCASEQEAYAKERSIVADVLGDPDCRNIAAGGMGLTSAVAKVVMNRPERKAIARAVVLRYNAHRVRHMLAVKTKEQRSATGRAGGSAGKGVSRNVGPNNPMYGRPPADFASYDATLYRLREVATSEEWIGTKSDMRLRFGRSPHWYSLCYGKRKHCRGFELVGVVETCPR